MQSLSRFRFECHSFQFATNTWLFRQQTCSGARFTRAPSFTYCKYHGLYHGCDNIMQLKCNVSCAIVSEVGYMHKLGKNATWKCLNTMMLVWLSQCQTHDVTAWSMTLYTRTELSSRPMNHVMLSVCVITTLYLGQAGYIICCKP